MSQLDTDVFAAQSAASPLSPASAATSKITRTVAIIKNHALDRRFDIEPKIQEASFEIVKERQMEFDTETDPDTLYELFGEDAATFNEGPVWVYVLERRRAVQVWQTIMGDPDPEVARATAPHSLRALYGTDRLHNAVMGSSDPEIAEIQIASLFASSPPFPTAELPDEGQFDTMRSVGSSILSELRNQTSDEGYAASNATNPSSAGGISRRLSTTSSGMPQFKARPLPATHTSPDIVPRTTKAAALRAGVKLETTPPKPKVYRTKEEQKKLFMDVPGHKRSGTISVASTAAPAIAPRMTRAASLRLGQKPTTPAKARPTKSDAPQSPNTFEGVPGHKRRETISVASIKAPTVAPRLNKSAALRASGAPPPSSFMFRLPSSEKSPQLIRSPSSQSLSTRPASVASISRTNTNSRPTQPRSSSVISRPSASLSRASGAAAAREMSSPTPQPTTPTMTKPKPRLSTNTAPSITPRTNKSAQLRAAKMEEEAKAAAAKAKAKKPMARKSMMV